MGLRATSKTKFRAISLLLVLSVITVAVPAVLTVFGQSSPSQTQQAPKANAGPAQTVSVGDTVLFDGSASIDTNGDSLSFNWTLIPRPEESATVLTNSTAVMPSIEVDQLGT